MKEILIIPFLGRFLAEEYVISYIADQPQMTGRVPFTGELLLEVKDGKVIRVKKKPAKREE
ncbi:hypothetical protein ACV7JQ_03965 [Globicatella sulfidifaciens]